MAAAARVSCPTTSPMASTVVPVDCWNASYQSPPISAPSAAGTYRTTISQSGIRGGSVSMLRCSASASARCWP